MKTIDLKKILEQTDDKLSIFANPEIVENNEITISEFLDLIKEFLSDEEKLELFGYSNFMQFKSVIKGGVITLISDENILLQILNNDNIMNEFRNYQKVEMIKNMSDSVKKQLLYHKDFMEKHQINNYDIISSLSEETRIEILEDINLITNRLHLKDFQIANLIKGLSCEEAKMKMLEIHELTNYLKVDIINSFSSNSKIAVILKKKEFNNNDIIRILQSLDIETLCEFLVQHKAFCIEQGIYPCEIICKLDIKKQKEFIKKLENINLTLSEKREILAVLKLEVKQSIDTTNIPKEYKSALSIQTTEYGKIKDIDFERELEDYRGLDNLIKINPEEFTEEQRTKFVKLCDICPNLQVANNLNNVLEFVSTGSEYKEAEEWISSIINKLNSKYSKAQKMAVIDNEIGKKISYSPEFDTEVFNIANCRALWKIISSGYGVCNGIASVEQYIFKRIGIESEIISSGSHSFLKIINIELPLANGEIIQGNTILDPTWNLARHRFGGRPDTFCISYKQARESDIDEEGKDHNCHKNDEKLKDATINLDDRSLRELFKSVGLADENGQFLIKNLIERSKKIDEIYASQSEQNINKQFLLLKQTCPEFTTCQNSSMSVLSGILLNNENLKFDKCVVNRVYDRTDEQKKSIIYVYINSNELGKKFYFGDNNKGQMTELSQEEFTNQFECYENDIERNGRI